MPLNHCLLYQILIALSVSSFSLQVGVHYEWIQIGLVQEKETGFVIPKNDNWWMLGSYFTGCLVGSIAIAFTSGIRRKTLILFSSSIFLVSLSLLYFGYLSTTNFFAGLGSAGPSEILFLYLSEILHCEIRGALGLFPELLGVVGQILAYTVGNQLKIKSCVCIYLGLFLIHICTFFWMPDSPYSLLIANEETAAKKVLTRLRKPRSINREIIRMKEGILKEKDKNKTLLHIVKMKSNRRILLILFIIVNTKLCTSDYTLEAFDEIFTKLFDVISPSWTGLSILAAKFLGVLFNIILIEKIGRKYMMMLALVVIGLGLLSLAIYLYLKLNNIYSFKEFHQYIILFILMMIAICISFVSSILWVILCEMIPLTFKELILSVFGAYRLFTVVISNIFFEHVIIFFDMSVPFFIFSILCFINLIFVYYFVLETKGKTLEEIQEMLDVYDVS